MTPNVPAGRLKGSSKVTAVGVLGPPAVVLPSSVATRVHALGSVTTPAKGPGVTYTTRPTEAPAMEAKFVSSPLKRAGRARLRSNATAPPTAPVIPPANVVVTQGAEPAS